MGGEECHVQDFPASQEDPKFHVVSARPGCSPALRYCWPSLALDTERTAHIPHRSPIFLQAQVSRDERNEYHGITVDRAQRVLDAMNETLTSRVEDKPLALA